MSDVTLDPVWFNSWELGLFDSADEVYATPTVCLQGGGFFAVERLDVEGRGDIWPVVPSQHHDTVMRRLDEAVEAYLEARAVAARESWADSYWA